MIISISKLKLKSIWKFGAFMKYTAKSVQQLNKSKCLDFKANIALTEHYTYSLWENQQDLHAFSTWGEHRKAVKNARRFTKEIKTYTYEGDSFPGWKEAKSLVNEKGKAIKYG